MKSKHLSIIGIVLISVVLAQLVYAQTLDKFVYMPVVSMASSPMPESLFVAKHSYIKSFDSSMIQAYVVGEIKNNTVTDLAIGQLDAELLDTNGQVLGLRSASLRNMKAGGLQTFLLSYPYSLVTDTLTVNSVSTVRFIFRNVAPATKLDLVFPMTITKSSADTSTFYYEGYVVNSTQNFCSVAVIYYIFTAYDSSGNPIDRYEEPQRYAPLNPGMSAGFSPTKPRQGLPSESFPYADTFTLTNYVRCEP